jgi:glutathione peroxidase
MLRSMSELERIPVKTIDGRPTTLGEWAGKVRLVVNVASKCGLTPQYTALEALYRRYRERGLEVLGFPANDFGAQEPGTEAEIATFCSTKYDVTFPMFAKLATKGPGQHPLYAALVAAQPEARTKAGSDFKDKLAKHGLAPKAPSDVSWNFEKFLVDRAGNVVERFAPEVVPDAELVTSAIERELGR